MESYFHYYLDGRNAPPVLTQRSTDPDGRVIYRYLLGATVVEEEERQIGSELLTKVVVQEVANTQSQAKSDNVQHIASASQDALAWTAIDCLEDTLRLYREGADGSISDCGKLLILAVNDQDNRYDLSFAQAGMQISECVALIEAAKARLLVHMGVIEGG